MSIRQTNSVLGFLGVMFLGLVLSPGPANAGDKGEAVPAPGRYVGQVTITDGVDTSEVRLTVTLDLSGQVTLIFPRIMSDGEHLELKGLITSKHGRVLGMSVVSDPEDDIIFSLGNGFITREGEKNMKIDIDIRQDFTHSRLRGILTRP